MLQKNRIAILLAGFIGAVIGGFLGYQVVRSPDFRFISFPIGGVSGFLFCLIMAKIALKMMKGKPWKLAFLFGPLFGAMAGGITGAVTGISAHLTAYASFLSYGLIGAVLGSLIGVVAGFILGPILVKIARKEN